MDKNIYSVIEVMPKVQEYERRLLSLNRQLNKTTLTGKISNLQAAETLFEFMEETSEKFSNLQQNLVHTIVTESVKKIILEASSKAQVCIDILIRNLFERTADVGFLATDEDLTAFMAKDYNSEDEFAQIHEHLNEYVKKYSVYSEILLLDMDGSVKIHLNQDNKVSNGANFSDVVKKVVDNQEEYTEYFGYTGLVPDAKNSLLYMQNITNGPEDSGPTVGVLVLVFKFDDEMEGIFNKLDNNNHRPIMLLIDEKNQTIATNHSELVPIGKRLEPLKDDEEYKIINYNNKRYIATSAKTQGYEGYFGIPWKAFLLVPLKDALNSDSNDETKLDDNILQNSSLLSDELKQIKENSEEIEEDLVDTIINGELIASKTKAYSLNPVLENIRNISSDISEVVNASIEDIHKTIAEATLGDVEFLASLAIDIMDRNLYERANDCRWWALNSELRAILDNEEISMSEQQRVTQILQYINSLYTVYTNLFVFDRQGKVIAVSNQKDQVLIGQRIHNPAVEATLRNTDSQKYFVSEFEDSELYQDKPTYTYYASITQKTKSKKTVGGIGIVFDSEPQFKAILSDSLPKTIDLDEKDVITENKHENLIHTSKSFAVFTDRKGKILSTTNPHIDTKERCKQSEEYLATAMGESKSGIIEINDKNFTLGCVASSGYREYKNSDGYSNDILALVFMHI